ncbi:hypothetical protein Nmel_014893 [Mimus melanotis]
MLLECFSYESGKCFLPWILPPSPRTFEFLFEKKEEENTNLLFPSCPFLIQKICE